MALTLKNRAANKGNISIVETCNQNVQHASQCQSIIVAVNWNINYLGREV